MPAIFFAAALITILTGCSNKDKNAAAQAPPPAVPVVVATVEQKTVPVTLRSIGNVEPFQTVAIKSMISAELTEVHFTEGQDVRAGDLLFTLDRRPLEAELRRAESNMVRDQAAAKNARVQAARYKKLLQEGVVAQQQYDQILSQAEVADATVAADQAAVENARVQLQYTRIESPISGRTGNLVVHKGNLVKANDNPALVTINQISPIYVQFSIPEQQLAEVKRYSKTVSLKVSALIPGDPRPAEGKLTFIDNAVETATGTIKLKASFANADRRLWPGQFVDTVLTLTEQPNAIVVPSQAVQTGQQGTYVFVIQPDMTADTRLVTVTRSAGQESVVVGVQAGERVVVDGQLRLFKGAKVEIKSARQSQSKVESVGD